MKYLIIGVVVLLVLGGVWFFYKPQTSVAPAEDLLLEDQVSADGGALADDLDGLKGEESFVFYDGANFSPATVNIKKGGIVVFENNGSADMWPASAMHPTHADYPVTGGCLGSIFDACQGIAPDDSWSFAFDVVGSWKYHDHLNPKAFGTIVVE